MSNYKENEDNPRLPKVEVNSEALALQSEIQSMFIYGGSVMFSPQDGEFPEERQYSSNELELRPFPISPQVGGYISMRVLTSELQNRYRVKTCEIYSIAPQALQSYYDTKGFPLQLNADESIVFSRVKTMLQTKLDSSQISGDRILIESILSDLAKKKLLENPEEVDILPSPSSVQPQVEEEPSIVVPDDFGNSPSDSMALEAPIEEEIPDEFPGEENILPLKEMEDFSSDGPEIILFPSHEKSIKGKVTGLRELYSQLKRKNLPESEINIRMSVGKSLSTFFSRGGLVSYNQIIPLNKLKDRLHTERIVYDHGICVIEKRNLIDLVDEDGVVFKTNEIGCALKKDFPKYWRVESVNNKRLWDIFLTKDTNKKLSFQSGFYPIIVQSVIHYIKRVYKMDIPKYQSGAIVRAALVDAIRRYEDDQSGEIS